MISDLFLKITKETHPFSSWKSDCESFMKLLPVKLNKDIFGNYWYKVGNSKSMFTCHLDNGGEKVRINRKTVNKNGRKIIITDGKTPLGADNKAGVVVLINMIQNNIPGLYYFFIGEEDGGIGSKDVASNFYNLSHLDDIEHIISFDRKGYQSIITHQMGERCCSDQWAEKLINCFKNCGMDMVLDPTGRLTDSMNFKYVEQVKEITNISVGYFNEHTNSEYQDITFLEKLIDCVCKIDWETFSVTKNFSIIKEYHQFCEFYNLLK
jgi:hypothetical protein